MKLHELLQERIWTVLDLANAVRTIKDELKDKFHFTPKISVESCEIMFEIPADMDVATLLKKHMKPFVIKIQYSRDGDPHQYFYYLTRPLVGGEITRLNRSI